MKTSNKGRKLIEKFEGLILRAYDDYNDKIVKPGEKVRGTLTIGYGHSSLDCHRLRVVERLGRLCGLGVRLAGGVVQPQRPTARAAAGRAGFRDHHSRGIAGAGRGVSAAAGEN
jgi:hypothetical protein